MAGQTYVAIDLETTGLDSARDAIIEVALVRFQDDRIVDQFATLVDIIARLRAPDGCPWDRKQTHASLREYLLEECYEALEALDEGDIEKLKGELGDILLQIMLHAQIADEAGEFTIGDVIAGSRKHIYAPGAHSARIDQTLTVALGCFGSCSTS